MSDLSMRPARVLALFIMLGAMVTGTTAPAAAQAAQQESCFSDAAGDVDTSASDDPQPFDRADIAEFCLTTGETLEVSMRVVEATDPTADPNWDDEDTFAAWGVDTDGDAVEDYTIVFGIEGSGELEGVVVDAGNDAEVCTAQVISGAVYGVTGIPRSCLGEPGRVAVNASMFYDENTADPGASVFFDYAPDDETFVGHAMPCDDAPVASQYEDRGSARAVHRPSVDCVIHLEIAVGYEREGRRLYEPLREVTRAQMATFIVNAIRAAGDGDRLPSGRGETSFRDIAGNPHERSIKRLSEAGIISGTSRTRYEPGKPVSRQQMATFTVNAAEFSEQSPLRSSGDHFQDVDPANTHFESINVGYEQGLFTGTTAPEEGRDRSGSFTPSATVKRDQMASFLTNLQLVTQT